MRYRCSRPQTVGSRQIMSRSNRTEFSTTSSVQRSQLQRAVFKGISNIPPPPLTGHSVATHEATMTPTLLRVGTLVGLLREMQQGLDSQDSEGVHTGQ